MATLRPDDQESAPRDQEAALGELLVAYHQQLIDQSRLSTPGKADEQASTRSTDPANELPTPIDDPEYDSAILKSIVTDPQLAAELVQLEDCLWRLEEARRATSPAIGAVTDGSAKPATGAHGRIGRFEILRELGRGGLGVVFLAHDPVLNRNVAIKVPRGESLLAPELRKRFLREAQAAARLTHPNIVPVYEVGEAGPISYIASAYIAGQSLAHWLREQSALVPVEVAAGVVADMADAMHYAHSQGVLHRDLKPANVLLGAEPAESCASVDRKVPNGKITDFGLAKLLDLTVEETRSGAILGTPAYMSPEQADGQHDRLGPATDIYSLGVMLYELLAGRPPYRGASDAATLVQVMQGTPTSLRQARAEVATDLEAICLKCLEREPASRYASAGELAADLRRYLNGDPTQARPLSAAQRLGRWTKRNPILATLSAATLLLLVGIAGLGVLAAVRIAAARDEARQTAVAERLARQQANKSLLAEQVARREAEVAVKQTSEARQAADQQAANAKQVSKLLTELFTTGDPLGMARLGFRDADEVGLDLTLKELLSRGARQARETLGDQPLVQASLLDTLGSVYSNLGLFAEAEPLLKEAYELRKTNGAGEADLATSKVNLGSLLRWQGKLIEAETLLREALATRTRSLGPDELGVAEASFALAWLLLERALVHNVIQYRGKLHELQNEAAALIASALEIRLELLGPDHRDVGLMMVAAALGKWGQGDTEGAKKLLLDATNNLMQQEGGERLLLAMGDVASGTIARNTRDFETAISCYRSALAAVKQSLGKRHPLVLMMMGELAGTLRDSGNMAEAELLGRQAVELGFESYPQGHPMLVEAIQGLCMIAESRGEYAEAEAQLERISDIKFQFSGNRPDQNWHITSLRISAGRYSEALELLRSSNFENYTVLRSKADIAYAMGQTELAEKLASHLSEGRDKYNLASAELYGVHLLLGLSCYANKPKEIPTQTLLQNLWNARPPAGEKNPWPQSPELTYPTVALARVFIAEGRHAEVAGDLELMSRFLRAQTIPGNWCIGYAECVTGQLRNAEGKYEEAEALLLSGLANLRKSRGEHHPITREAAGALVKFYQRHGRDAEATPYESLLKLPEPIAINYELPAL